MRPIRRASTPPSCCGRPGIPSDPTLGSRISCDVSASVRSPGATCSTDRRPPPFEADRYVLAPLSRSAEVSYISPAAHDLNDTRAHGTQVSGPRGMSQPSFCSRFASVQ
jgi:hypothetical protein